MPRKQAASEGQALEDWLLLFELLLQMHTSLQRLQLNGHVFKSIVFLEQVCVAHLPGIEVQEWGEKRRGEM